MIPARGDLVIVTPAFEEPSVRETLAVGGDVRPWNEHESPFERIVQALKDRGVASGPIAFESTTRLFIVDGVRQAAGGAYSVVSGDALVRACRMVKSPAELALLQIANTITLEAIRHAHAATKVGSMAPGRHPRPDRRGHRRGRRRRFRRRPRPAQRGQRLSAWLSPEADRARGLRGPGRRGLQRNHAGLHIRHQPHLGSSPRPSSAKVWATVKRGQEIALETCSA